MNKRKDRLRQRTLQCAWWQFFWVSKRKVNRGLVALAVATLCFIASITTARAFIHPGGLHTDADFQRMSNKVAQASHPWVDSFNQLTPIWLANLGMPWHPVTQIVRGPTGSNYARSQEDALAIYYHALRWRITGDTRYADEAIQGMDLWSSTMIYSPTGDSNYALACGICGYEFAIAGEALRGYTNWSQTSISNYCNFLRLFSGNPGAFGTCEYFLATHQGTCDSHYWCNWDACNIAALMSISVFCDDTNMFNYAVNYAKTGNGNGNLASAAWFIHPNGLAQWEESGRDQAHTMDGIAWLGVALQVAWNQGVDLFGFDNNRYLRGLEYSAKYNVWQDVPYQSFWCCEGNNFAWGTWYLNGGSRGFLPPEWDLFYNHYVNIQGLSAPWTAQAAATIRPDGFYNNANSPDFLGFTTLTCLQDPPAAGAVPSGLTARVYGTNVLLNWWGSTYATNYLVKRATVPGGPYTTMATIPNPTEFAFTDGTVTNGGVYYYVVSAQDKFGESPNSPETRIGINQLTTYYRFSESSGVTASDASGLSPSATLMNGASFTGGGKFGNAVNL
ncbi:MAG TPA: alginate lyase family protein, partial [Verrucomicrobiae bacterium]